MPELPEVETIVRGLREEIVGRKIKKVKVRDERIVACPEKDKFIYILKDKIVNMVDRRGKYILIRLSGDYTLIIHLRMTGRLYIKPSDSEYKKHTHIIFELDNGFDLRFNNTRKFGRAYLVKDDEYEKAGGLINLGPEPLSSDFTLERFKKLFKNRRTGIKAFLLNQQIIAGLGNIYADEALFRAGIAPDRGVDTLSVSEMEKLYQAVRSVLKAGIEHGGTTFSDYLNARGETGQFQNELMVYQRAGEECPRCGQQIIREKHAGRSSHFCPRCQK